MVFLVMDGTKHWSSISKLFLKALKRKDVSAPTISVIAFYHRKLSHKPLDNFILKPRLFDSKIKLFHGLVSFQRERTNFLRNSTHMQGNEKNIHVKQN